MSRQRKLLLALISLTVILAAGLGLLLHRLDLEAVGQMVENRISTSFGLQVRMEGDVELHLLPPGASFADIAVDAGKEGVLTARRVRAGVALLPLLRKKVQLSSLTLDEPTLSLRRDESGQFQFKIPDRAKTYFEIGGISIRNGAIRYSDAARGTKLELTDLTIEIEELHRDEAGRYAFSGDLRSGRLGSDRVEVRELSGPFAAEGNLFRIEPLRCALFGSGGNGRLEVDLRGEHPVWKGDLEVRKLSLEKLSRALAGRPLFEGTVELRASLSGEGPERFMDTMDGTVGISGTDLVQHGFDLDRFLGEFRASRDIDLVDVGVFAFTGPVGSLVSKGVDMTRLVWAAAREDRQDIEKLVSNWSLKDGVARAEDVAFRTRENRLAVKGAVDLGRWRYDDVTLGLLNAEGCAELTEKISGPLADPSVEKISMLATLAESLVGVLKKGWEIIDIRDCRPFYEGTVAHPGAGEKSSPD